MEDKKKIKESNTNTPYDDVHRTLINDCPKLIIPVMKVQNYSIEEIFEKRLFFLIPFHIFTYEQRFEEYEVDSEKLQELMKVYEEIVDKLNGYAKQQVIDEYTKCTIIDMSKKVLEHLAKKYSNVKEGVRKSMGGQILDYEAKQIRDEERAKERVNTERERQRADEEKVRADEAESRADEAENRVKQAEARNRELEAEIARLKGQANK